MALDKETQRDLDIQTQRDKPSDLTGQVLGLVDIGKDIYNNIAGFISGSNKTSFNDVDEIFSNPAISSGNPINDTKMVLNRIATSDEGKNAESIVENGGRLARDRNGNLMAFFQNGSYGYVNKPGFSRADFDNLLGSYFLFRGNEKFFNYISPMSKIPFIKNIPIIRDAGTLALAGAGTSVTSDVLADLTGSKSGIDTTKALVQGSATGVVSGVGSTILNNVGLREGASFLKRRASYLAPRYLEGKDRVATQEAEDVLKNLTKDDEIFNTYTEDDKKIFAESLEAGFDEDLSKSYMVANKFGISFFDAQINRDEYALKKLQEAAKGAYGQEVQKEVLNVLDNQNKNLMNAAKTLSGIEDQDADFSLTGMTDGQKQQLGDNIASLLSTAREKQQLIKDETYALIKGNAKLSKEGLNTFKGDIKLILEGSENNINTNSPFYRQDYPNTSAGQDRINTFIDKLKNFEGDSIFETPLTDLKGLRTQLSNLYFEAKGNDRYAMRGVLEQFDKFQNDIITQNLKYTDMANPEQLNALTKAVEENAKISSLFEEGKKTKTGGIDFVGRFVEKAINGDATALDVIKVVDGKFVIGKVNNSIKIIDGLYNALSVYEGAERVAAENELRELLKQTFHVNLIDTSLAKTKGEFVRLDPNTYYKNVSRYLNNKTIRENFLPKIMSDLEIKQLEQFASVVNKTAPGKFNNASNTAATLAQLADDKGFLGVGRVPGVNEFLKIYAYNANGLKGLFTYRAVNNMVGKTTSSAEAKEALSKLEKNLYDNVPELSQDFRRAFSFAGATTGFEATKGGVQKRAEKFLGYPIPIMNTYEDIDDFRKQITGYKTLDETKQKEFVDNLKKRDQFTRIMNGLPMR